MGEHALATIEQLDIGHCHIVGHDLGGLLALWLAVKAPNRISSASVVASMAAAPTGDWLNDLAFTDPPEPLWSAASQRWALDRVSHQLHHIDDALIGACVEAAGKDGPTKARKHMAGAVARAAFIGSMNRAKTRLWTFSRADRFPCPLQIIWGAQDPLTTYNHGLTLFQTLAQNQPEAQLHLIDRSGSFVFREQPDHFRRVVEAFRQGLAETECES
jgi:pimeloyl-ACP methyl ester carboxylesterase